MQTKLKYIMFDDGRFILFPLNMSHNDLPFNRDTIKSAGFVQILDEPQKNRYDEEFLQVHCYGESVSLDKKADSEKDTEWINMKLRLS